MIKKLPKGITGVGFEFVEDSHAYYLDGVRMTGVTTILAVIAKPALIQWAANEAVKYVKEQFDGSDRVVRPIKSGAIRYAYEISEGVLDSILEGAKSAHRKKKEDAGTKGTDVHAVIEIIIKTAMEYTEGKIGSVLNIPTDVIANAQVRHFVDWALQNDVKFLASEERVFSRELFMGGTIDFICEINGEVWLGDIKTASGIYPEFFFQTAGYQKLLSDMALTDGGMKLNIKGHIITCLKKDGTFEEKRLISNEDNLSAFLAAFTLYRVTEKLKGNII